MNIPFLTKKEDDEAFLRRLQVADSILPFLREGMKVDNPWTEDFGKLPSAQAVLEAPTESRAALALDTVRAMAKIPAELEKNIGNGGNAPRRLNFIVQYIAKELLRYRLALDESQTAEMLLLMSGLGQYWWHMPVASIVGCAEKHVAKNGVSEQMRKGLAAVLSGPAQKDSADMRKVKARVESLLHGGGTKEPTDSAPPLSLKPNEPWANAVIEFIGSLSADKQTPWLRLFDVARRAPGSSPSAKWLKNAKPLIEAIGIEPFKQRLCAWMKFASKGPQARNPFNGEGECEIGLDISNGDVLRGLVWSAASLNDPSLAAPIADFAEACFKKLPYIGPRSPKVGNACLAALTAMTGDEPAAQISRLNQRVKQPTGRKMAERALGKFADRAGLTPEELEERNVPAFGLNAQGTRSDVFGEFTAITTIIDNDVELTWQSASGKAPKSVPASVKQDHAAAWKELQNIHKQIKTTLPAQRERIERLYRQQRTWALEQWRKCYADHPLVSIVAKKLVWRFRNGEKIQSAAVLNGKFVDASDRQLQFDSATQVSLWHPIQDSAENVLAWRNWLEKHEITQPFKQAHREIYILTEAERRTDTYSNRFAAHVLRQHQFAALAQQRGWTYRLQGRFDSHNVPFIDLPTHNIKVEFWVDAPEAGDTSEMGIFLQVLSDQVRFCGMDGNPRPLTGIEPMLFSELMRDIDLFVGVSSIGNDPEWVDREDTHGPYWRSYSFGDLTATAITRKQVLERLIPRLKIADRCSFADKFLIVRGDKRTYKIHLGSSNIMMEPNDQYLCIVPDRKSGGQRTKDLFLPFEGDNTLSIIISKAFLLAEDDKITDPTILRQIER